MKKILILLFSICMLLTGCNKDDSENKIDSNKENENTNIVNIEPWYIETPYGNLAIPKQYKEKIKTEILSETPYIILFKTIEDNHNLFTLYFGQEKDELVGTLSLKDENIVLYVEFEALDTKEENYNELLTYQATINTIIDYLSKDYKFYVDQIIENVEIGVFEIETDLAKLYYPLKWEGIVDVENEGDVVKFTYKNTRLFDVYFKECNGDLIGFYDDTPVYLISYLFNYSSLTDEEYNQLCEMQHDINVIIEHLLKDEKFVQ